MNLRSIYTPAFIREWATLLREKGWRGFVREKGWKILFAIFMFYFIRDSVLYIIIPVLIAQGILSH